MSATWIKVPAGYFTEPAMMFLRRELKRDADALPLALWLFAAQQDGTGDLSAYTPEELAEALRFRGDPDRMVSALQAAGYLTEALHVVDWEDVFGLCRARSQAGRTRALKRWGKTTQPPSTPPPEDGHDVTKEDQALRQAVPDAFDLPFASPQFSEAWRLYVQHRRESKKPLRPTSTRLCLEQLREMGEQRAITALRHTVAMGWIGVREPTAGRTWEKPRGKLAPEFDRF